ncbi:MAG: peptidoglycan DD-metalloendopeptidase family protein [Prevotellaceae bacterium]|jgi:septal ring factor EnvC (AmiA/AmiB activator)|nr:peptidoglycan DD-metalloendopeptidase family protein [Prevotellaceae bacterium]
MKRFMLLLMVFMASLSAAQSVKDLEARKKKTLEQIEITNKLIRETQKSKTGATQQITLLSNSIKQANALIAVLNDEIAAMNRHIDTLRTEKQLLETRIQIAKDGYAKLVAHSSIYRKHFSPIIFIISANSFVQAYRRMRYLTEVSQSHKQMALEIQALSQELSAKEQEIVENLTRKSQSMTDKEKETRRMNQRKEQQAQVLSSLKKKEKELAKQKKKQQEQANQLNKKIEQIIAEELRKEQERARKKAEQAAKAKAKKGTDATAKPAASSAAAARVEMMSHEDRLIAGNFEKNKGRLPFPVEKGIITNHYGRHTDPLNPHVMVNNINIAIQTTAGADARAIFEGEVVRCFVIQGNISAVIIKHGNYFTCYGNLTQLYVKRGDKVATKQKIGKIFVDPEDGNKTELSFSIHRDKEVQNPELWLVH